MGFLKNLRDNMTDEQRASLQRTYNRSFLASAFLAAAMSLTSVWMNYSMDNGGMLDVHAKVDETMPVYMEQHPDLTEDQARANLNMNATAVEKEIGRFALWNPIILWGTAGVMFMGTSYRRREDETTSPQQTPKPRL